MNDRLINTIYEKFIKDGRDISLHECSGGYPDREDCTWYHGNWMLFRYLGVVSNPYWHENFYRSALEHVHAKDKDLLIAGTADFSMPLLCSESDIQKLSICDICATPLKICDKVSNFLGYSWTTYMQDICIQLPLTYDIIINDAFLSRFADKLPVLRGISNGLKLNGYYITTLKHGIWNRGGDVSDSVKEAFIKKVRERYDTKKLRIPSFDIEAIALEYVNKMSSFPVNGEDEIHSLFDNVGLDIVHLEKDYVEGEFEVSEYFRIISKKK